MLVAEAGRAGGEDDVAGEHQLEAAGQAQALARGYHRQRAGLEAAQHRVTEGDEAGELLGAVPKPADLVEVGTGAEMPALRPDQHRAHAAFRRLEFLERAGKGDMHRRRQAVELVRAGQLDDAHAAFARGHDHGVGDGAIGGAAHAGS